MIVWPSAPTIWVPFISKPDNTIIAILGPAPVGAKLICSVHDAPGANIVGQSVVKRKSSEFSPHESLAPPPMPTPPPPPQASKTKFAPRLADSGFLIVTEIGS